MLRYGIIAFSLFFMILPASASANEHEQGLILVVSVGTSSQLTRGKISNLVSDVLKVSSDENAFSNEVVPRRLYNRFARIMKKESLETGPVKNDRVSQVPENLNQWYITGYGTGSYQPDHVVLQWRDTNLPIAAKPFEKTFDVENSDSTDTDAVVQALRGQADRLLVRPRENWELIGFRLEWKVKSVPGKTTSDPESGFKEWPAEPPCFLLVIPAFEKYGKTVGEVFDALRKGEGVTEVIEVKAPDRPLKLVALDLEPLPNELSTWYQNYYTIRIPKVRDRDAAQDPLVWALFPLTTADKDRYLNQIIKIETEAEDRGSSGITAVAEYIQSFKKNQEAGAPPYLPIAESVDNMELPAQTPSATAVLQGSVSPKWYEIPAIVDEENKVQEFARTLRIDNGEINADDSSAWVLYVYARKTGEEFRAAVLDNKQAAAESVNSEYGVAREEPFISFLNELSRAAKLSGGN